MCPYYKQEVTSQKQDEDTKQIETSKTIKTDKDKRQDKQKKSMSEKERQVHMVVKKYFSRLWC